MTRPSTISWLIQLSRQKNRLHILFCIVVFIITFLLTLAYTANLNTSEYLYGATSDYAIRIRTKTIQGQTTNISVCVAAFFLGCIYTGRHLCRHLFPVSRVGKFLLYLLLAMLVWLIAGGLLMQYLFHPVDMHFFSFMLNISPFILLGLIFGLVVKLTRVVIRRQLDAAAALAMQKQTELNLLQSQLSPHFLFNTLNNLHSIAVLKQELIPDLLLRLSDLLRYSVYDTRKVLVPLSDELLYIDNYIAFEQLRTGGRLLLKTDIEEITDPTLKIAPMLLIVFIENAFKHAKNTADEQIFIDIVLKMQGRELEFTVVNSYSGDVKTQPDTQERSGMGLVTTMKRLQLLYPNKYVCRQQAKNGYYEINIKLNLG